MSHSGAPYFPVLGQRFGRIQSVWNIHGHVEQVAIVEEVSDLHKWWLLYRWVNPGWEMMGAYISDWASESQPSGLFAEVIDVATAVYPQQIGLLVVKEGDRVRWWVAYGTSATLTGPIVAFSSPVDAFVVPI
jgi:hypothetical protein